MLMDSETGCILEFQKSFRLMDSATGCILEFWKSIGARIQRLAVFWNSGNPLGRGFRDWLHSGDSGTPLG